MSLQWTLVAGFLYAEMFVLLILMLPFISATMWQKLFKSRSLQSLVAYSNFYFSAFFLILCIVFLDSIRQMQKYSSLKSQEQEHGHLDAELQQSVRMFRAQRNCYIAGFALFLAPVIRRIGSLISRQAMLMASTEAAMRQATSASDVAEKLMKEKEEYEKSHSINEQNEGNLREEYELKIRKLKGSVEEAEIELEKSRKDLQAVKKQAEGTNREYDSLMREHTKLQDLLNARGDSSDKKDE